jgi:hypothetical protein
MCALLLCLIAQALSWFSREYTHDDFYLAYLGWIRSTGLIPGRDYVVPNFNPLAESSSFLFAIFEESMRGLEIIRWPMLAAALVLIGLTFEIARRLSGSIAWGAAAAAITAWHPQVVVRISDIRTDQLAISLVLLAALLMLGGKRRPLAVGFLAGLAAVFSPKMVLALPVLGLAVLLGSRQTRVRAGVRFTLGAAAVPLGYFAIRIAIDGWSTFRGVLLGIGSAVGDTPSGSRFAILWELVSPVAAIALLVLGGAVLLAFPWPHSDEGKKASSYAALVFLFLAVFLALNPALYAYNAIVLVPLLAPLISGLGRLLDRLGSRLVETALLALISLLAVTGGIDAMNQSVASSKTSQQRTIEWLWENTSTEERAFDWQGMHFGRRGIFHWWTYSGMQSAYHAGEYRLRDEWKGAPVSLILYNYRIGWLTPDDADFLRTAFVPIAPCAFVPGLQASADQLAAGIRFEVFVSGLYETTPRRTTVLINGMPAQEKLLLERGTHTLEAAHPETAPPMFGIRYLGARKRLPPCSGQPLLHGFPSFARNPAVSSLRPSGSSHQIASVFRSADSAARGEEGRRRIGP